MNETENHEHPSPLSWLLVVIAWTSVGIPLFWGIFKTLEKAKLLFG